MKPTKKPTKTKEPELRAAPAPMVQHDPTPAQAVNFLWQYYSQSSSSFTGSEHQLISRSFNVLNAIVNPPVPPTPAVMAPVELPVE